MKFMIEVKDEALVTTPTDQNVAIAIKAMIARGLSINTSDIVVKIPTCHMATFSTHEPKIEYWGYQKK